MALTHYGKLRNQILRQTFPSVFAPVVLRDADSHYVPIAISERLVQCIWHDQRLQHGLLRTTDGRSVRVIFQGWWNLESGPDFRRAIVQIGDQPEVTGDVEIHLRTDDWFHHAHHRDPQFDDVILHVVLWEAGSQRRTVTHSGHSPPQLVLQHQLDAPLESLFDEIDIDAYPYSTGKHRSKCVEIIRGMSPASIQALLSSAGDERFAAKVRKFVRWIHRAGADQAFYEGWMEGLGYKANKIPFRAIAQRISLSELGRDRALLAPLLFGIANFLPLRLARCDDPSAKGYVKRLWNTWWKYRPDYEPRIVPESLWKLRGIRPANHPHRRLGAAVSLIKKHTRLLDKIVLSIERDEDPVRFFMGIHDEYWSHHFTLGGKAHAQPLELVGNDRAREIVVNIVLPFACAFAQLNHDNKLLEKAKSRYDALSAASTNSVERLASVQFFGSHSAARHLVRTTRHQQGLMQIFQDFCLNDKSACRQCQFPELARQWASDRAGS